MSRVDKLLEFLADSPQDSFLQHALALEYIKIGRDVDARTLFDSILEKDPGYIGSYYHLGKLLERAGELDKAVHIYQKGMDRAKEAGDRHSYNELQGALEEIVE